MLQLIRRLEKLHGPVGENNWDEIQCWNDGYL